MSDGHEVRPEPEDDRYDHRLKLRVARAHLRLADANVMDHALAAIAELAMGRKLDGTKISVHPRTQVQAAKTLLSSAASITPKDPLVQIQNNNVQARVDREAYRRALADPESRKAVNVLLRTYEGRRNPEARRKKAAKKKARKKAKKRAKKKAAKKKASRRRAPAKKRKTPPRRGS